MNEIFSPDVNECDAGTDSCHDNAACTNTSGGYTCECNTGWTNDDTSGQPAGHVCLGTRRGNFAVIFSVSHKLL